MQWRLEGKGGARKGLYKIDRVRWFIPGKTLRDPRPRVQTLGGVGMA